MIGMAVRAIRSERDDHVRPDTAQMTRDRRLRSAWVDGVERAIRISKHGHLADAEFARGGAELCLARGTNHIGTGPLAVVAEASALAACGCHERCLDAFRRVLRQSPARTERLVVRMCQDTHQPERRHRVTIVPGTRPARQAEASLP